MPCWQVGNICYDGWYKSNAVFIRSKGTFLIICSICLSLSASKRRPANSNEPIEWEYSSGNAHLGTFTSNGTDLIVPRDGTYRIYLQITYTRPEKVMAPPNVDSLEVTLLIFKMAYKTDEALLQCYDKVDLNSLFRKSLYTAATFDLKFNDRLKVKTTNPELMVLSECTTFFGADLISWYCSTNCEGITQHIHHSPWLQKWAFCIPYSQGILGV